MSYNSRNDLLSSINGTSIGGLRNRIVNGDMRIDQANAGAAVTINSSTRTYSVDMWSCNGAASAGIYTIQQSTSTPPDGFTNFIRATVTTSDATPAAGSVYYILHAIEGVNCQDLLLGTANAKTITISFLIRSSLTGTFSGSIVNSAATRSFPFSFTITTANVWQQIVVTLSGDVSGTWLTTTGIGALVFIDLGCGSTFRSTTGTWQTGNFIGVTNAVRVISTNGATLDITGFQLEVGPIATAFEIRSKQQELQFCQRYYSTSIEPGSTITNFTTLNSAGVGGCYTIAIGTNDLLCQINYPVQMRIAPTLKIYSGANRTLGSVRNMSTGVDATVSSVSSSNPNGVMYFTGGTFVAANGYSFHYTADARF